MATSHLILSLLFVIKVLPSLIYIPDIPVDPMTLIQLKASCNMLHDTLNIDPSLPRARANDYY